MALFDGTKFIRSINGERDSASQDVIGVFCLKRYIDRSIKSFPRLAESTRSGLVYHMQLVR